MSGSSSPWYCGGQRPPLQPRGPQSYPNTMKVSGNSVPAAASSVSSVTCKRHNIDTSPGKSENEPLALYSKRQRTKSGTDTMEGAVSCSDANNKNGVECCASKSETSPLCEHNVRTSKSEIVDGIAESGNFDSNSVLDELVNGRTPVEMQEKVSENGSENQKVELSNVPESHTSKLASASNDLKELPSDDGGFSPHCSSTLEYVTQLPEGCSGIAANPDVIPDSQLDTSRESDGELDDDNYLDSSEGEEDDEFALTNNEEDESCGEGKYFINCIG